MIFSTIKMLIQYRKYGAVDYPEECIVEKELMENHDEE